VKREWVITAAAFAAIIILSGIAAAMISRWFAVVPIAVVLLVIGAACVAGNR
jgi:hypothetical protein